MRIQYTLKFLLVTGNHRTNSEKIVFLKTRYHPVPSYTSAVKEEDFKAAAIFEEMEKKLKGVCGSHLICGLLYSHHYFCPRGLSLPPKVNF